MSLVPQVSQVQGRLKVATPREFPTVARLSELYEQWIGEKRYGTVPSVAYNILIVGDGYTEADDAVFHDDVDRLTKRFRVLSSPLPGWIEAIFNESWWRTRNRLIKDLCFYVAPSSKMHAKISGITDVSTEDGFRIAYTAHPWFSVAGQQDMSLLAGYAVYEKANALRRYIRETYEGGPLMHRVLVLTNSSRRGAGHTGGALIVPGGYEESF